MRASRKQGFVRLVSSLLTSQKHAGVGRSQLVDSHAGVVAIAILGDVTHGEDGPGAHVLDVDPCLTLAESENTRQTQTTCQDSTGRKDPEGVTRC